MDISYYGDTGGTSLIGNNNTTLKILEYTKGEDKVAYIDGGVCRYYPEGSIMLADPPIHSAPDSLIMPTITVYNSNVGVAGNGLTRILFLTPYYSKMSQTIALPTVASFDVKRVDIKMESDYADAFGRYFADTFGFTPSAGPNGEVIVSKSYPSGIRLQLIQSYLTIEAN